MLITIIFISSFTCDMIFSGIVQYSCNECSDYLEFPYCCMCFHNFLLSSHSCSKTGICAKWVFVVVYDFPARVFRPNAATSNTWRFKQTLSNPGWRVIHTVWFPMASSMTSSQRSISLQQMHSCGFVTRLTEQFEHEHLQNNVKNSSNTRIIHLYKIIV